jgi:hypothetical protein
VADDAVTFAGVIYNDVNGNGQVDDGEGASGISVSLYLGPSNGYATTDASGRSRRRSTRRPTTRATLSTPG